MRGIKTKVSALGIEAVEGRGRPNVTNLVNKLRGSFFDNAVYITLASLISSIFGLFFWIIAARLYPEHEVGLATALFSAGSLIITVSRMGFDNSITRYFPEGDKSKIFTSVVAITTLATVILSSLVAIGIEYIAPDLVFIRDQLLFFVIFLVLLSFSVISNTAFISARSSKLGLFQNLIMGSRLIFLLPLIALGAIGILTSIMVAYLLAALFSLYLLYRMGIKMGSVDWHFLKGTFSFTAGNYVSDILLAAPILVLPVLVLNALGSTSAAHYFIAYSFASIIYIVPTAFSMSLFVEGSHGESLFKTTKRALVFSVLILIPIVTGMYVFGYQLLSIVGGAYATQGYNLMIIMSLSSFFITIFLVLRTICKIRINVKSLVILSILNCALLVGLSVTLMPTYGLDGIGYAWIVGNGLSAVASIITAKVLHFF